MKMSSIAQKPEGTKPKAGGRRRWERSPTLFHRRVDRRRRLGKIDGRQSLAGILPVAAEVSLYGNQYRVEQLRFAHLAADSQMESLSTQEIAEASWPGNSRRSDTCTAWNIAVTNVENLAALVGCYAGFRKRAIVSWSPGCFRFAEMWCCTIDISCSTHARFPNDDGYHRFTDRVHNWFLKKLYPRPGSGDFSRRSRRGFVSLASRKCRLSTWNASGKRSCKNVVMRKRLLRSTRQWNSKKS